MSVVICDDFGTFGSFDCFGSVYQKLLAMILLVDKHGRFSDNIYNLKKYCAKLCSEFLLPIIYRKLLNRPKVKLEVESQNWVKGYK